MKFSLITVTMGNRTEELQRLCDSLSRQTCQDYEHIIVDQRDHPEWHGGLSRARNYGLSLVQGDVVAFPDDDAWYAPNVLEDVEKILKNKSVDGVSFRVTDDSGNCSAGGWMSQTKKWISKSSVWHTVVSCSFFLKKQALGDARFDERLGCGSGTRFGSGEETDLVLSALEDGARIVYDGTKTVFHPLTFGEGHTKGWRYGNGMGAVLRTHHYSPIRLLWAITAQLARSAQAMLHVNFKKSLFHSAMAAGRLCGYLSPPQ